MATNYEKLRIEPVYDGQGQTTAISTYKVVDENGTEQMRGSHTNCYYFIHPEYEDLRFKE
jgi:hypothetical protein